MKEYNLEFCFKGNRTYVHGTDIYNNLIKLFEGEMKLQNFDLSFHGIAKRNIIITEEKPRDEKTLKFLCKLIDKNDSKKIFYGIENSNIIECRYAYPEEDICKLSILDLKQQEIVLTENSGYSFVENCVALNKFLLENLFPDVNGKWYFTRFQIKDIPIESCYPLKLILKSNFNFKLTKTEIFHNDKSLGFIYFSLV
ncbi:MAG: hypothetical protein PHW64_00535 [Sulfuricurvum sp.]|nr:hypothetical protein [Sulfuricurvum sp.]